MAYMPRIIIQTANRGCGWYKEWYLVTPLAFLSFQSTSVFLSAYLEAYGYSQTYFRKTVTLSMDLRPSNLPVAAVIRFKIQLLKQILVPACRHHVLAKNWCHVLDLQGKFPACYLGVKKLPHGRRPRVPWHPTPAGAW